MLWQPSSMEIDTTQACDFMQEVNKQFQTKLGDFEDLYQWSCNYPELFWSSFWDYASIIAENVPKSLPCGSFPATRNLGTDILGIPEFLS